MFENLKITPLGDRLYDFVMRNPPEQHAVENLSTFCRRMELWWKHQLRHIHGTSEYGVALMHLLRSGRKMIPLHSWLSNGIIHTLCLDPFGNFSLLYMKNGDSLCLSSKDTDIAEHIAMFSISTPEEFLLLTELIDVAVQHDILRMKAERVERESPGSIAHAASLGAASGKRVREALASKPQMSNAEARAVTAAQE